MTGAIARRVHVRTLKHAGSVSLARPTIACKLIRLRTSFVNGMSVLACAAAVVKYALCVRVCALRECVVACYTFVCMHLYYMYGIHYTHDKLILCVRHLCSARARSGKLLNCTSPQPSRTASKESVAK